MKDFSARKAKVKLVDFASFGLPWTRPAVEKRRRGAPSRLSRHIAVLPVELEKDTDLNSGSVTCPRVKDVSDIDNAFFDDGDWPNPSSEKRDAVENALGHDAEHPEERCERTKDTMSTEIKAWFGQCRLCVGNIQDTLRCARRLKQCMFRNENK